MDESEHKVEPQKPSRGLAAAALATLLGSGDDAKKQRANTLRAMRRARDAHRRTRHLPRAGKNYTGTGSILDALKGAETKAQLEDAKVRMEGALHASPNTRKKWRKALKEASLRIG